MLERIKMIRLSGALCVMTMAFIARPVIVTSVDIHVPPSNCSGGKTSLDSALEAINENKSNISVYLEPGEHCINEFEHILEDLHNVTLEGEGNVIIRCLPERGLAVFNATALTVRGVTFDQCGVSNTNILRFLTVVNAAIDFFFNISANSVNNITVLCGHCVDLQMSGVTVKNTLGLGLLGINLIGESILENVTFSKNVPVGCYFLSSRLLETERVGGGALLIYSDYHDPSLLDLTPTFKLDIVDSRFLNNSFCSKLYTAQYSADFVNNNQLQPVYFFSNGGGLSLKLTQLVYKVNFTVRNSEFRNNTARGGGGANIELYAGVYNSSIEFIDCLFLRNGLEGDLVEKSNYSTYGSGMVITTDSYNPRINQAPCLVKRNVMPTTVAVSGGNFTDNRAFSGAAVGIISLYSPGQRRLFPHFIKFDSCVFKGNYAFSASALSIQEWKYIAAQPGLNVILKDVQILKNTNFKLQAVPSDSITSGIVHVVATNVSVTGESAIEDNEGSGVYLDRAILHVDGNLSLSRNSASVGGGIRVEAQSLIIISNNSQLNLIDNRATVYGGGIYSNIVPGSGQLDVPDCSIYFGELNLLCFQDFAEECANISNYNLSIKFKGNVAQSGSMVFGTTLDSCPWAKTLKTNETENESIFDILYDMQLAGLPTLMNFDKAPNSSKELATPPVLLIVSNLSNESMAAVPGHSVTVHAIALDQFNRSAVSILTSLVDRGGQVDYSNHSSLGPTNYWLLEQNANSSTLNVSVTVYGDPSTSGGDFNVTLVTIGSNAQENILVHLIDCPPGFTLDSENRSCICDKRLKMGVYCVDDESLSVPTGVWIGYRRGDNSTLVQTVCHFDYCVNGDKNVSNGNFSSQCGDGSNRDGVGCGGCKEGYGLVLGSNKCDVCSDYDVLFIFLFALIGVLAILFTSLVHVSVSNGYINGVLFYASVISIFNPVLASQSATISGLLQLFSWLNLELDYKLCFHSNLGALERAALRFVFPLYLYGLMGCIILVSKFSQRFANVFNRRGYSATKLFATLFVLTYTSILGSCIEILGFSYVTDLDQNIYYVWISDSNQAYFEGAHIPLCLLAITILIVYLIPAPLVLLFPGLVLRVPLLKNYKPLYDAFWAPFKPNFRFWIGMRLFLRFFPLIFAYFVPTVVNVLMLIVFLLLLAFAEAVLQPFQGRVRNASDLFFLMNLVGLLSGYLYFYVFQYNSRILTDSDRQQELVVYYFASALGLVYLHLLISVIVKIFVRFPKLQYYVWRLLAKVCFCEVFAKWIPEMPKVKNMASVTYELPSEYTDISAKASTGTDLEPSVESSVEVRKINTANFSKLREPLLDS